MGFVRLVMELMKYPLNYPWTWLLFAWMIWLVLKWRDWTRPTLLVMLIHSVSVGIFYITSLQSFQACLRIEICAPTFSVFTFIAAVSFWMIVLYIPTALTLPAIALPAQVRKNWWFVLPATALAAWHFFLETIGLVRSLEHPNLISSDIFSTILSDIFFYPIMLMLLPWLFWLLLPIFHWPTPTFLTMCVYSIGVVNAATRLWIEVVTSFRYEVVFSLPVLLLEVMIWFITLYILMRLSLRIARQVPV